MGLQRLIEIDQGAYDAYVEMMADRNRRKR